MTTLENVKNNSNIKWLLNKSEVTYEDNDCTMTFFKGRLPKKMLNELNKWFNEYLDRNNVVSCHKSVDVGLGSVNLVTSKWKGNTNVIFTTCLGK